MLDLLSFLAANSKMDYFEAQCSFCPKTFTSETSLKKHKFHVHLVDNVSHDCYHCGKQSQNKYKLNMHTRNQHSKKTCEICNFELSAAHYSRHKKEAHLVVDKNTTIIKCGNCAKSFTRKESLDRHAKSCHTVNVNC